MLHRLSPNARLYGQESLSVRSPVSHTALPVLECFSNDDDENSVRFLREYTVSRNSLSAVELGQTCPASGSVVVVVIRRTAAAALVMPHFTVRK